jgi:asparagine synthase (glutamine-hydrolysing)
VFAGYRRYRFHMMAEAARRLLPGSLRRRAVGALARAYPKLDRAPRWLRAKTTLTEISLDSALGYYGTVCKLSEERRRALFSPAQRAAVAGHDPASRFEALMAECDPDDALLQAQYADLQTYLPSDILTKVDRTSMAVSLEVRPPLLDPELVSWGMALPATAKLRGGVGKRVLRAAAAPLLPATLLKRRKRGFATELGGQFRDAAVQIRARLTRGPMADSGLFDLRQLGNLVDQHASGDFDHTQVIWNLLVVEGFLAIEAKLSDERRVA